MTFRHKGGGEGQQSQFSKKGRVSSRSTHLDRKAERVLAYRGHVNMDLTVVTGSKDSQGCVLLMIPWRQKRWKGQPNGRICHQKKLKKKAHALAAPGIPSRFEAGVWTFQCNVGGNDIHQS